MRFEGRIWKHGKHWLIEVPLLEIMTQGYTRREAFEMIRDAIEGLVDEEGFEVFVHHGRTDVFEISASRLAPLVALMLRRRRLENGVSLGEAIARMGQRSKTAYTRYEQGKNLPSIEKLAELFAAVDPDRDLVLRESRFPAA